MEAPSNLRLVMANEEAVDLTVDLASFSSFSSFLAHVAQNHPVLKLWLVAAKKNDHMPFYLMNGGRVLGCREWQDPSLFSGEIRVVMLNHEALQSYHDLKTILKRPVARKKGPRREAIRVKDELFGGKCSSDEEPLVFFQKKPAAPPAVDISDLVAERGRGKRKRKRAKPRTEPKTTSGRKRSLPSDRLDSYGPRRPEVVPCAFCGVIGHGKNGEGRLLHTFKFKDFRYWVHHACAILSPRVYFHEETQRWVGYQACMKLRQFRQFTCPCCLKKGTTIGCSVKGCNRLRHSSVHALCGVKMGWSFAPGEGGWIFFCQDHVAEGKALFAVPASRLEDWLRFHDGLFFCAVCRGPEPDGGTLVECDYCEKGYHLHCLERDTVPPGRWLCPRCVEEGVEEDMPLSKGLERIREERKHL